MVRLYLSLFRERDAVMPFLFHSLFRDEREIALNAVDPLQRTTVAQFRQFIEYYLAHGYQFITPGDPLAGLNPGGKYAVITFDDGYYNNTLALANSQGVQGSRGFFYLDQPRPAKQVVLVGRLVPRANRARRGRVKIWCEGVSFKKLRTDQIEAGLSRKFGPNAFVPRGDVDRPFNPAELEEFAANSYVHIGNHTADHAILTNYTPEQVRWRIVRSPERADRDDRRSPIAIAYPNGAHNDSIVNLCGEFGLKVGFTVRPEKARCRLRRGPDRCFGSAVSCHMAIRRLSHNAEPIVLTCCFMVCFATDTFVGAAVRSLNDRRE